MNENQVVHLLDVPIGGKDGLVWNRLHGERENICEALVRDSEPISQTSQRRDLLQGRLRRIDDALDRLLSGSYGLCSQCGQQIGDAALDVDPARAICLNCRASEANVTRSRSEYKTSDSSSQVILQSLHPFDTILMQTSNSEYTILLLEPNTGRALVKGGECLVEPGEALLMGSAIPGSEVKSGAICVGGRVEIWAKGKVFLTSSVHSVEVKHNGSAESVESLSEALH